MEDVGWIGQEGEFRGSDNDDQLVKPESGTSRWILKLSSQPTDLPAPAWMAACHAAASSLLGVLKRTRERCPSQA